jgi:hypothetical protein
MTWGQSLTPSTPDPNSGDVITIKGRKYVLVPERTFQQIERMVDEVPALRDQVKAQDAEIKNSNEVIAKQTLLIQLKDSIIESETRARTALEKALEFEKQAGQKDREALAKAETRVTELEGKVKRANRRALIAGIGGAVLGFFLLR